MEFLYFLGRFHVLVLHLPIALVLAAVAMEWLSRRPRYSSLQPALGFMWGAAALTAIATVVLGYMHFAEGGFTGPSAIAHRLLGTSVAVVATLAWLLRSRFNPLYERSQLAIGIVLLILVTLTGHYGGNLTHGDTYLVQYAPGPIRRLAGLEEARAPVTDIAQADPYLDIVQPILAQRCTSCHNDDKQRGGLNLASLEAALKGGEDGAVLVAGKPEESDLYRRISLPRDHEDFMPAEGKTPLTADQTNILRWWIEAGLPTGSTVGALQVPDEIRPLLAAQLGVGAGGSAPAATGDQGPAQAADAGLLARLSEAGFSVRQRSLSDAGLIVSAPAPGARYTVEQLATLASAGSAVVELNLSRTNLGDEALAPISQLTGLTHLRLDNNDLSDAGLAALTSLAALEYLNLFGNQRVTDKGLDSLQGLPALRELYVWGTGVTSQGIARFRQRHADVTVEGGISLARR